MVQADHMLPNTMVATQHNQPRPHDCHSPEHPRISWLVIHPEKLVIPTNHPKYGWTTVIFEPPNQYHIHTYIHTHTHAHISSDFPGLFTKTDRIRCPTEVVPWKTIRYFFLEFAIGTVIHWVPWFSGCKDRLHQLANSWNVHPWSSFHLTSWKGNPKTDHLTDYYKHI